MSSGSRRRLSGLYLRFTFRHRVQRQRQKEIHGAVPRNHYTSQTQGPWTIQFETDGEVPAFSFRPGGDGDANAQEGARQPTIGFNLRDADRQARLGRRDGRHRLS
jgi:hypothetical protein